MSQAFAADNSTRFPFTLSWQSAWRLLIALDKAVDDLDNETDVEYKQMVAKTLFTELQYLSAWIRQYASDYVSEEQFEEIEAKLLSKSAI